MKKLNRRRFLAGGAATAAALGLAAPSRHGAGRAAPADRHILRPSAVARSEGIVDTHVYIGRWPFRHLPGDEIDSLLATLEANGVGQAWAGPFEALFHKDVARLNRQVERLCRERGGRRLLPVGTVNVKYPGWERDVEECRQLGMRVLRVHPTYQNYDLDGEPAFKGLLHMAAERDMIVQVVAWMQDERHHHPMMPVPRLNLAPLPELVESVPSARVQVINGIRNPELPIARVLAAHPRIWTDFGNMDTLRCVATLLEIFPEDRVCFSSFEPMIYIDMNLLKMQESAIPEPVARRILSDNARALLGPHRRRT